MESVVDLCAFYAHWFAEVASFRIGAGLLVMIAAQILYSIYEGYGEIVF